MKLIIALIGIVLMQSCLLGQKESAPESRVDGKGAKRHIIEVELHSKNVIKIHGKEFSIEQYEAALKMIPSDACKDAEILMYIKGHLLVKDVKKIIKSSEDMGIKTKLNDPYTEKKGKGANTLEALKKRITGEEKKAKERESKTENLDPHSQEYLKKKITGEIREERPVIIIK